MRVAISSDSGIDLPKDQLEKYDIHVLPFTLILGEDQAFDGEITPDQIFEYVDKNKVYPKTSAINQFQFEEHFSNLLKDYDAVIHISLNSKMSSACQNAFLAAWMLENVYVIDSESLCTGIALLAIYARTLLNKGFTVKEVVEKVEARKKHLQVSLIVHTTSYLYHGGRCTALQRIGSALLRIKPSLVLKDGGFESFHKYIGKSSFCVKDYVKDLLGEFNNPDLSLVFISHSSASEHMIENAEELLKASGFKNIIKTYAGGTISCHAGPKALGVIYFNDGEQTL